jgi:hypothetical protein
MSTYNLKKSLIIMYMHYIQTNCNFKHDNRLIKHLWDTQVSNKRILNNKIFIQTQQ